MAHPSVDKFGQLIVASLRDRAIDYFDRLVAGHWKGETQQNLHQKLAELTSTQISAVRECVIKAVDVGMHDFLFAIVEAHDFDKGIEVIVDGDNIVELSDGLHGEQFTDDGWIAKFGKFPEQKM